MKKNYDGEKNSFMRKIKKRKTHIGFLLIFKINKNKIYRLRLISKNVKEIFRKQEDRIKV